MSKRIFFFVIDDDLLKALLEVQRSSPLRYAQIVSSETRNIVVMDSASEIDSISDATHETASMSKSYLVTDPGTELSTDKVELYDGGVVYQLYESNNPGCIRLIPAGRWNSMVLSGTVVAFHDDPASKKLMRRLNSGFKKSDFVKINGHWIGPKARELLSDGVRFGDAEQSPSEYDFRSTD